jgi:hypothetical protein
MPRLTRDFDRVIVFGLASTDSASFDALDHVKIGQMVLEIRISEDYCCSDIYVVDLAKYTLGHVPKFTLPLMKKYLLCAFVSIIIR